MTDLNEFARQIGRSLKKHVVDSLQPLADRIKALEDRQPEKGEKGEPGANGKDADPVTLDQLAPLVDEAVSIAVKALPAPVNGAVGANGKDADPEVVKALVSEAVAAIPAPQNGKDADPEVVKATVAESLPALVDPIKAQLSAELAEAVKAIPAPKDGKSVTVDDIRDLIEIQVNRWALEFERRATDTLQKAIDRIPAPKDGKDGTNGLDGLGFDDMTISPDGERGFVVRFCRGEVKKEMRLSIPAMIYRGVYVEGKEYAPGDTVTWAGSLWHCDISNSDKPGESGVKSWTLAAKRGRDGKDGEKGKDFTRPEPLKVT